MTSKQGMIAYDLARASYENHHRLHCTPGVTFKSDNGKIAVYPPWLRWDVDEYGMKRDVAFFYRHECSCGHKEIGPNSYPGGIPHHSHRESYSVKSSCVAYPNLAGAGCD